MAPSPQRWTSPSAGLGAGLFFVFALVLMDFSVWFALGLGLLGGLSIAWSLAWWNHPDPSPPKWTIGQRRRLERATIATKTPGIEEAQRLRRLREARSQRGRLNLFRFWRRR